MNDEELIEQAYCACNRQNADTLLAFVSDDVNWPDGQMRLHGKHELRTYWTRECARAGTRDEVLAIVTPMPNLSIVRIDQVVRALSGAVVSTGIFEPDYLIENRLMMRLDIRRLNVPASLDSSLIETN